MRIQLLFFFFFFFLIYIFLHSAVFFTSTFISISNDKLGLLPKFDSLLLPSGLEHLFAIFISRNIHLCQIALLTHHFKVLVLTGL